ncbi:uncharacterized protein STEHIDRAFT_119900, partial [Stereum hirsutum FP-91666 SS1]
MPRRLRTRPSEHKVIVEKPFELRGCASTDALEGTLSSALCVSWPCVLVRTSAAKFQREMLSAILMVN